MYKKAYAFMFLALVSLNFESAGARPSKEVETVYYSGPDFLEEVGGRTLTCAGGIARWGKTSRWFRQSEAPCESGSGITGCYATTIDGVTVPVPCPD